MHRKPALKQGLDMQEQAVYLETDLSTGCLRVRCSIPSVRSVPSRQPLTLVTSRCATLTSGTCCYALPGAVGGGAVLGRQLCLKVDAEQDLQVRSTVGIAQPAQLIVAQLRSRTTACDPKI